MWPIWSLGDETRSRISSKFNQLAVGLQVTQIFLPGSLSIYYGEEIQLSNNPSIKYEETVDSAAKEAGQSNFTLISRDPFRTPMKWNSSRHAGNFSSLLAVYKRNLFIAAAVLPLCSLAKVSLPLQLLGFRWTTLTQLSTYKNLEPILFGAQSGTWLTLRRVQ